MAGVAVVTGAGSGIGAAASIALADAGWTVVLAGRRPDALLETVSAATSSGVRMDAVPTDVTDEDAVRALFDGAVDRHGRVDLLFNNAGIFISPRDFDQLPLSEWRAAVDVNLTGSFLCAREAFRVMRSQQPQGGRIINNGSISAHAPRPRSAAYTATKHAITGLTKTLSLDGRPFDIACGQMDVGNAATALASQFSQGTAQADGSVRPEPTMDVAEVGRSVVYMAGLPLNANVQFLTILATKMPFVGRG